MILMNNKTNILQEKIHYLNEVLNKKGKLSNELMEEIKCIHEIIQLENSIAPKKRQYIIFLSFLLTLALLSVLLFWGPNETQVSMVIESKDLSFTVNDQYLYSAPIPVKSFTVKHIDEARFIDGSKVIKDNGKLRNINLSTDNNISSISLDLNRIKNGAKIFISNIGFMKYKIVLIDSGIDLVLGLKGDITGTIPKKIARSKYIFNEPLSLNLSSKKGKVVIVFTLASKSIMSFEQVLVSNISFSKKSRKRIDDQIVERNVSTVSNGAIYLDQLKENEFNIRKGIGVLTETSDGVARLIRSSKNKVFFEYNGSVSGLELKKGDVIQSIMPSYLELISENSKFSLLWGVTLYVFGLWVTFRKWWYE